MPGPVLDFSQVAPEQLAVAMDAYLDEVAKNVGNVAELPKWLHEQVVSDWKKTFTASAIGYTPTGTSTFEFEGEEGVDIPGIQVSINLYKLLENPEKTLKDFMDKQFVAELAPWRQEFWTDLDTGLSTGLYKDVVKGDGGILASAIGAAMGTTNKAPIGFWDQGVYAESLTTSSAYDPKLPVTAQPAGASRQMSEGEIDVYRKVGGAFTEFVSSQKSTSSRGGNYASLQSSFIKAATTELSQKKADIVRVIGGLAGPEAVNADHYITVFNSEAGVVESFADFNLTLNSNAFGVRGTLGKHAFKPIQKLDYLKGLVGDPTVTGSVGTFGEKIAKVEADITKVRADLRAAEAAVAPNHRARYTERIKDFDRRIKPIEESLDRAQKLSERIRKEIASPATSVVGVENLLRELTTLSTSISHQRYGGGIYNQYLMGVSREYFEKDRDLRNNYFSIDDPTTHKPIMSQGFYSIDPVYRYAKGQYLRQDGGDLIEALIKGDYLERRYWYGKWRNYIQAFTPGYWTGKVLERVGYFGLIYDEKKHLNYFLNKHDDYGEETTKARIGNLLLRPLSRKHTFGTHFKVTTGGDTYKCKGRFEGGLYLSNLNKAWVRAGENKLVGLIDSNTASPTYGQWLASGTQRAQKLAFINLINDKTANYETSSGLKYQMGTIGTLSDFAGAKKAAVIFRKKILKNKKLVKSLGLELDASGDLIENDKNIAILDGLFKKFNDMDKSSAGIISPFVSRIGTFNWLSSKLTRIQHMEAQLLKPFVKPLIALRELVKNLAGKAFRTVLYGILGTVTGGAGAFLMKTVGPWLEKIFNATFARLMKYFTDGVSKAFKAMIKGDINAMLEALAEEAAKMMAWVMACGCAIPIFFILFTLLVLLPVINSISPVDRSKATSSSASAGVTVPGVPNDSLAGSNCPVKTPRSITLRSYNPSGNGTSASGHGSKWYWTDPVIGFTNSYFSIPYLLSPTGFACPNGFCSPDESAPYDNDNPMSLKATEEATIAELCRRMPSFTNCVSTLTLPMNKRTYAYGYAMDVSGGTSNTGVYAPNKISCGGDATISSWMVRGKVPTNYGYGVILEGLGSDGKVYKLFLLHLATAPSKSTYAGGEGIASVKPESNHVHIELAVDNVLKKPEDCMCK